MHSARNRFEQYPASERSRCHQADLAQAVGHSNAVQAASTAMVMRAVSVHRLRAMPQMACATTATATTFKPCSTPAGSAAPHADSPSANSVKASAEGSVKPAQASSAPLNPARDRPIAMPTWLLAGPGKNWHSATRSA